MLFAIICTDKPGSAQLRADTRPRHLQHLESLGPRLKFAGPTLDDGGEAANGSLIVLEAADLTAARAFAAEDPYAKAGLFQSVVIRPWRHVLGSGV